MKNKGWRKHKGEDLMPILILNGVSSRRHWSHRHAHHLDGALDKTFKPAVWSQRRVFLIYFFNISWLKSKGMILNCIFVENLDCNEFIHLYSRKSLVGWKPTGGQCVNMTVDPGTACRNDCRNPVAAPEGTCGARSGVPTEGRESQLGTPPYSMPSSLYCFNFQLLVLGFSCLVPSLCGQRHPVPAAALLGNQSHPWWLNMFLA